MRVKRYLSQLLTANGGRKVRVSVDPDGKYPCEIPVPKQVTDERAIEFAKETYDTYSPNRGNIEFVL